VKLTRTSLSLKRQFSAENDQPILGKGTGYAWSLGEIAPHHPESHRSPALPIGKTQACPSLVGILPNAAPPCWPSPFMFRS
jgi:hypothetical protein